MRAERNVESRGEGRAMALAPTTYQLVAGARGGRGDLLVALVQASERGGTLPADPIGELRSPRDDGRGQAEAAWVWRLGWGMMFLPLAALLLLGCGRTEEAAAVPAARPVKVAQIAETTAAPRIVAAGRVEARDELGLSFKVGGVIASVTVDEGDRVRAGQVLATLALPEIDAQVAKAEAALEKAERDAARVRRLAADSVTTRAQLDDAETAVRVARADAEAARFNRRHAVIVAPAAGTVLRRLARPGETVSAGAAVVKLASAGRGTVFRAGVADRDLVRVREGDEALVTLDAYPGRTLVARVVEKGAAPLPVTGAYTITLSLAGAGELPTGLVGTAEIRVTSGDRVRVVPTEALVEANGREGTMFVLGGDGAVAERRRVTIAFVHPREIGIASGLDGASAVVTDGAPYLEDGEKVTVVP